MKKLLFALALLLFTQPLLAQTYVPLSMGNQQWSYNSGAPVAAGFLCFLNSGLTTKLDTYTTPSGTANANPVVLDAGGRASIFVKPAEAYTVKLFAPGIGNACGADIVGALIWSADDVMDGILSKLKLTANCSDSAGAAACGAASAGSLVIDAAATTVVVSTTAVTANSQIFVTNDSSLGTRLSVTCNTQSSLVLGAPRITSRTAATSFTVKIEVGPTTNPMCLSFLIVN